MPPLLQLACCNREQLALMGVHGGHAGLSFHTVSVSHHLGYPLMQT